MFAAFLQSVALQTKASLEDALEGLWVDVRDSAGGEVLVALVEGGHQAVEGLRRGGQEQSVGLGKGGV